MDALFPLIDTSCEEVLYSLLSLLVVLLNNGKNQLGLKICSIHGLYVIETESATYSRFSEHLVTAYNPK
jgi:hypothetical protein